jgi:predicted acyl esterase
MRDGVHLFTAVYVPKDSSQAYPFLITRTPYSVDPYGAPRALRWIHHKHHPAALHGRRPALRLHPPRRAHVSD